VPLDLNQFDLESLTEEVSKLRPGQSLMSNCGQVVRRRPNTSGYDCGVGLGGYGSRRAWKARDAAEYMMIKSAQYTDARALGGDIAYPTIEAAIEAVVKGNAQPAGPSPALRALRKLTNSVGLHSYRIRAQKARESLSKGNIADAAAHIEAIKSHAGENGRVKDVMRAEEALKSINTHHEYDTAPITARDTHVVIAPRDGKFDVIQNGTPKNTGMTRSEAEAFKRFLERNAGRAEAIADIDKEEKDLPDALREETVA
jgi:hypothetical protein